MSNAQAAPKVPSNKEAPTGDVNQAGAQKTHDWLLSPLSELALRYQQARCAQQLWAELSVRERLRRLAPLTRILLDRSDDLCQLIHQENGKPLVEAVAHEILPCVEILRFLEQTAARTLRSQRVFIPWMLHRTATVHRQPHGVVTVISPWNMPLSIPFGQVLSCLVAGNAVVLKPSEVTPRVGETIGRLLAECKLPPNLFSVVQGDGAVGAQLIAARPDKVIFTGSVATGRRVMAAAAEHPIPVCLELGGVDAMIVCEDGDLDIASSAAVWGSNFNGGQVCASVERLIVHESVRNALLQQVRQKMARLEPRTDLGRITAARQREVYDRHLADAKERQLDFVHGGDYLQGDCLMPTLIAGDGVEDAAVYREESFGPIVAVTTFREDGEAVRKHNNTPFGLTASVFSKSKARAEGLAKALRVGLVSINDIGATLHAFGELPWGGVGESGFGRSHGSDGLLDATWPKVIEQTRQGLAEFKRPWWYPYDNNQREMLGLYAELIGAHGVRKRLAMLAGTGRRMVRMMARLPRL